MVQTVLVQNVWYRMYSTDCLMRCTCVYVCVCFCDTAQHTLFTVLCIAVKKRMKETAPLQGVSCGKFVFQPQVHASEGCSRCLLISVTALCSAVGPCIVWFRCSKQHTQRVGLQSF